METFEDSLTSNNKVLLAMSKYESIDIIFPNKEKQANIVINSLANILNIELDNANIQEYCCLIDIYKDVFVRKKITESDNASIVAMLLVNHKELIQSENVAKNVFVYCVMNLSNPEFDLFSTENRNMLKLMVEAYDSSENDRKSNNIIQNNNVNDKDYGLTPNKPIYTNYVSGSNEYLSKLRSSDGQILNWVRKGSTCVECVNGAIDMYDSYLPNGNFYKRIYICMYANSNSTTPPEGFVFIRNSSNESVSQINRENKNKHVLLRNIFGVICGLISFRISMYLLVILAGWLIKIPIIWRLIYWPSGEFPMIIWLIIGAPCFISVRISSLISIENSKGKDIGSAINSLAISLITIVNMVNTLSINKFSVPDLITVIIVYGLAIIFCIVTSLSYITKNKEEVDGR